MSARFVQSDSFRILNAEPDGYSDVAMALLRQAGRVDRGPFDRSGLLAAIPDYDVLIVRLAHAVDREVFESAPRLKVVVTATTGLDHVDLEEAAARGIDVLSLRGEFEFLSDISSTAEHTWALLLALVRRVPAAFAHVIEGKWDRDAFRGIELRGLRLGIVGLGRLGRRVAEYGRAFGMEVLAHDRDPTVSTDEVRMFESLIEMAGQSDVLSVHLPLDASTVGLIDGEIIAALPDGSFLLNTARAEIVDCDALTAALRSGHLAGAAVDVIEGERKVSLRQLNPLVAFARDGGNVIITPHIGGATRQAMERTEVFMAEKLLDHLSRLQSE